MMQVSEVSIISIDKSEDSWAIEGEVLFEEDLSTDFSVTYLLEEDELEEFSLEIKLEDNFDMQALKRQIIDAAMAYDE